MRRLTWALVLLCLFHVALASAAVKGHPSGFSYTPVLAKYVAGSSNLDSLGEMGCLSWTDIQGSLVFKPYQHAPFYGPTGFFVHLLDPSWAKGAGLCKSGPTTVSIPFDRIKTLARGQVQTMGEASSGVLETVTALGGASAVATALTSIKRQATRNEVAWGAGGLVVIVAAAHLNRRTQNYIAIFYEKQAPKPEPELPVQSKVITRKYLEPANVSHPAETVTVQTTKAPNPSPLFCNCKNFAVFQIIDPHDYWNTSMLLNAMTGLTFVPESAAQTPPAK